LRKLSVARARIGVALILPACLGGCLDYPAVGRLSASMQASVATWQPMVDDLAASCHRRLVLSGATGALAHSCDSLDDVQGQIARRLTVLDAYFAAMQAVASDDKFAVDDGLGAVAASIKQAGANGNDVDAATAVAGALAGLLTAHVRGRAMDHLIDQAKNAAHVVATLQQVIDTTYGDNLRLEADKWRQSMTFAAAGLNLKEPPPCTPGGEIWSDPPPALSNWQQVQFETFYAGQCATITARQAALQAFDKGAGQLVAALTDLDANRARLKDGAVIARFLAQAHTVAVQAQAVQAAFSASQAR
jgi:hypothetical protein